ncbi:serine/threonine protein kinase [Lysobacter ciconiae]|uniref:Serine/threonine protein kinase n=1 Tax=Novilysobacter ciconiae TaxID=2781022 RepID=A0A7S6ZSC4_9GAMM|nr:serine/threonine-protein kinase [Lysobacter ciconiae]QOW19727.1 serine/threonine protein kinase [Lysobacter ciconiae]
MSPLLDELFGLDPGARERRLHRVRAEDPGLADELAALIALDEDESFLAEPALKPSQLVMPGRQVGPYRLEHLLGEGGMGQVWLASRADGLYQRRVGLKLLRPGLVDTNLRLRFSRERQILARLAHPHIARLLDAGISSEGLPYLALEYIDGIPITDYCREHDTPLATRLHMFEQVCAAVSHAHANLIVHRDLKPSNILVTPGGDVRLLDFGIAKLLDSDNGPERTRTDARAFTLHYAAPEQILGEPVTTMTDVYSLGVVLYELLVDAKPYRPVRGSDAAWEESILMHDPVRPSQALLQPVGATVPEPAHDPLALRRRARLLAGDLDNIVLKALSKPPEQRYPSVEALAQDLLRYASGRPVRARAQSWRYRMGKFVGRHRWPLATGTLTTALLTVALLMGMVQSRQAVAEAARAQAIQAFMIGVLESAGDTRDGQPMDMRTLLMTAVARGERELADQPVALAEVLGVVAGLHIGLGEPEQARRLLDRQARLLADVDPVPEQLRLDSLIQRGRVAELLGDPAGCIQVMRPGLPRIAQHPLSSPLPTAAFRAQLSRCRVARARLQRSEPIFERVGAIHASDGIPVGQVDALQRLTTLLHGPAAEPCQSLAGGRDSGGCIGSIDPSPRTTFLYSARDTDR